MDIEQVGPDDHYSILGTWFTTGVATEVLTKSTNKAATDVNEARSNYKTIFKCVPNQTKRGSRGH